MMTINARAIIAILAAGCLAGPALADDQPFSKWFRYGSDIDAIWKVAGDPANPMQVSIRRKDAAQREPAKRLLVLYPRPSSAYDIAITKILRYFHLKESDFEFTIVNFEIKDGLGKEEI